MSVDIGTVRTYEVTSNKDGDDDVRLLQVEFSNSDDLQTVEQIRGSGEDSNPQPGSRVVVLDIGRAYRVAIAIDDGIAPTADEGEKEIYSYDSSLVKKAYIKLAVDGTITVDNSNATIVVDTSGNVTVTANKLILNDETDAAALASLVDQFANNVHSVLYTWIPVPNDGGAAFQTAWKSVFGAVQPTEATSSAKLKTDA